MTPKSKEDVRQSIKEEKQAIRDYGIRGKRSSGKLKQAFGHARGEEKQHAKMFKEFKK